MNINELLKVTLIFALVVLFGLIIPAIVLNWLENRKKKKDELSIEITPLLVIFAAANVL